MLSPTDTPFHCAGRNKYAESGDNAFLRRVFDQWDHSCSNYLYVFLKLVRYTIQEGNHTLSSSFPENL